MNEVVAMASPLPRLLVLASTYPRWAGDHEPGFVHELCKRLARDFEVEVICPHAPGAAVDEYLDGVRVRRFRYAPKTLETLVNDGGILENLKRHRWKWLLVPPFFLGMLVCLWREVLRWRPAVVHAHWLLPQGFACALMRCLFRRMPPFVVTSHGADLFGLRARPLQRLKRWIASQAAAITVVSEAMLGELDRLGVESAKVRVQSMGVDLGSRFVPDAAVTRSSCEILFVGRLVEKKGLRHLLAAMPAILAAHPGATLTVAGFGPELEACQTQANALEISDRVRFLGAVGQCELPGLYQRAAVLVAPFVVAAGGDQEGLGLVSIEAVGCGCPVVASRLPATQFLLGLPSVRGVAAADSDSIAAAVIEVLSVPPGDQQRTASREACIDLLDWQAVGNAYSRLLADCMLAVRAGSSGQAKPR